MREFISYGKIGQFRNVVSDINRKSNFSGLDENDEPIINETNKKPILTFNGTVKLHGTNAAIAYNEVNGFWVQSRKRIITIDDDNAGFAKFCYSIEIDLVNLLKDFAIKNEIDLKKETAILYGEWAGGNIQKSVGVQQLEKSFYIFSACSKGFEDENRKHYGLHANLHLPKNRVFRINNFQTFEMEIDFNNPQLIQNNLIDITEKVEKECPVAKYFGIKSGLGEGVVWGCIWNDELYQFKVKGEKHSISKVKKLASVDVEKLKSINEFVDYAVTENRVNQGIEEIFGKGELSRKKIGDFLRWIIGDITKEEKDVMYENDLTPKEVNKAISFKAREIFFEMEKV